MIILQVMKIQTPQVGDRDRHWWVIGICSWAADPNRLADVP